MLNKIKKMHFNKPAKIIAGVSVVYLLFSYFAVNPLAKRIVPWVAENHLASHASIGKMTFDPWRLKATIEDLSLTETNGAALAGFDNLVVDLEASGLFSRAWKFKEISIIAPRANIAISTDGKLNWAALIAKLNEDKTPPDDTIPRLVISHFSVKQANIQYEDANRAEPFRAGLTPLNFELDSLSTLPQDRGDYFIAAKLPEQGGSLEWKGNIGVNPIASKGEVAFKNIQLAKLMKIVKNEALALTPASGDIQASFAYDFSLPEDQPRLQLNNVLLALDHAAGKISQTGTLSLAQAKLTIPQLDFSMRNSKPQLNFQDMNLKLTGLGLEKVDGNDKIKLLSLPQADINQVTFDLTARKVKVAQILLADGTVSAARNKAGIVNWQQAFSSPADTEQTAAELASAETAPAAAEPETPFTADINDIQLQHWHATYHDQSLAHPLQLKVADLNLGFMLAMPQGNVEISNLQSQVNGSSVMSALFQKPVATLEKLNIDQGEISLKNQTAGIQSIVLSGLQTEVIKAANAPLNWQSILKPAAGTPGKTASATNKQNNQSDWAVSLKKLALDNASLHVEDRSTITPMKLDIEKAAFEMQGASLDLSRPLPVKATFRVKQGGQFNAQGKLTPSPLKANVDFKLAKLAIKPFSPYINQQALLKLNDGTLDIAGKLSAKEGKQMTLAFNGGFSINKLALIEEATNASFLEWERVSSKNLTVTLAPNRVSMSELQVIKPKGEMIIHEDGSMNLTRILRNQPPVALSPAAGRTQTAKTVKAVNSPAAVPATLTSGLSAPQPPVSNAAEPPAPVASSSPEAFPVSIDTVRIENGELDFADLTLTPQFGTDIHSLTGVINGVSTNAASVAQVELDGKVDEYGSARIRGSIQPFNATNFTDLKLSFKNLEMNRLTPYSGKFAGRHIDSGKLSVDLEYKIKQRQLMGENKFIINKLKLGEKVNSAEAANLPLDLAIAILEDSDGVIDLDLPISGSLDDPKFSYGSIVWKAIRNVLSKIITSPFRALGKLFGSGSEKLEAIAFEAGKSTLAPPEREKIKTVGEALNKRRGLALGIVPGYDAAVDSRAIQELTLRRKVAEEMGLELEAGQQAGPIDLSNPKTQKAIDALHDTLTKKGLLKKLVSKFEKPKEGHYEQAQEKLTVSIEVTESDLQALARSRGEAVLKALIDSGISADRLHIDSAVTNKAENQAVDTKLTLDVKATQNNATEPKVPADSTQPASQ